MKLTHILMAPILVAGLALVGCSENSSVSTQPDRSSPAGLTPLALNTIYDTAAGAGVFNTLVAAVDAADLEGALQGPGPLTVFASNDGAFGDLPANLVPFLLEPENKDLLTELLLYHVAAGELLAADVLGTRTIDTLQGKKVFPRVKSGAPYVNRSEIIDTDILASNGVIHVIDAVLTPPGFLGRVQARSAGGY